MRAFVAIEVEIDDGHMVAMSNLQCSARRAAPAELTDAIAYT
jgi:hypothetical protein